MSKDFTKLLFVTEKWCDCIPHGVFSHYFHNLFLTFYQAQPNYIYNTLHFDESYFIYGKHINEVLMNYCYSNQIKVAIFSFVGNSPLNPSFECIKAIKDLGIFVCFMWPDSNSNDLALRDQFQDIIDLNVILDNPSSPIHDARPKTDKELYLWTSHDRTIFFPQENPDIDVSFIGSTRQPNRKEILSELIKSFSNLIIDGGERETKMTPYNYAKLIRRSKIGLNFSYGSGFDQTKGRATEIISSGSLLIENKNKSTARMFKPGTDYIDFSSIEELMGNIEYYLNNESERKQIAAQGYKTYMEKYTSEIFWDKVMSYIEEKIS